MMKSMLAATALTLACAASAHAFEPETQAIIDRHKAGKLVTIADVATLMRQSERWCYLEDAAGSCAWSDVYLEVTDSGARFEIGNAWSETVDIAFTDTGTFEEGRYICESGVDWVPTTRARYRANGAMLFGRELQALQDEIAAGRSASVIDCFDYLFESADPARQTITLRQRQYTDDAYDPTQDVAVTLHFDPETAMALVWRW